MAKKKKIKSPWSGHATDDILEEYQDWAALLWDGSDKKTYDLHDLFIMTAGIGGETGEVLEILKKAERGKMHGKKIDLEHLTEELGDVLYYLKMLCSYHKISLSDVLQKNVMKIDVRYSHSLPGVLLIDGRE